MVRRRVTYLEDAEARPMRVDADGLLVDLDGSPSGSPRRRPAPPRRACPACPPRLAQLGLVVLIALGAALAHVTEGPDERRSADAPDAGPVAARRGPVVVDTRSVAPEPWRGVFEHHPGSGAVDAVDRVHALALGGPARSGLLVVDATRRTFGTATATGDAGLGEVRRFGEVGGAGLRTLQWDAGGYGISLTTVGLTDGEQHRLAGAVALPDGPSLVHGEPPELDGPVLAELGMEVTGARRGPASPWGSPLIGQSGGATIEGQLHQVGRHRVLVSVVDDQVVTAATIRDALGSPVRVEVPDIAGVGVAAVVAHLGAAPSDARVRGWTRLVLDHRLGLTIELSSDAFDARELLDLARSLDLERLARTVSPLG
jgi:hypothetical protein